MNSFLKLIGYGILISILHVSCASLPVSEREQDFVILKNKDTIYGEKIRFSRGLNKIGKVKMVKANGEKIVYGYDEIYQLLQHQKDGNFYVQEFIMLTPNNPISYTLTDVIINMGNVKLYEHDPTNFPNTPFVVSDFFHGYVRSQKQFKKLLNELDKCVAFRGKFSENTQRERSDLKKLIEFYNANCQ